MYVRRVGGRGFKNEERQITGCNWSKSEKKARRGNENRGQCGCAGKAAPQAGKNNEKMFLQKAQFQSPGRPGRPIVTHADKPDCPTNLTTMTNADNVLAGKLLAGNVLTAKLLAGKVQ
ncbi:hypothetical protein QG37_00169 [Candidozyma auris]|uniref:Uncharacterized protein n=1 Tax=Candidozyma auris TaxID=498019 RepID=A0A0L0P9M7_CANAR|nr:hypothetical protein QG37_00169 [[Candida] auris]